MCTIGALTHGGRTFLLKNFDYRPFPTGWAHFASFDERHSHFALVDHDQQGLNSGLNAAGLALQISRSGCVDSNTPEMHELRTVLNAEVLSHCNEVRQGVEYLEEYARAHPEMFGGNVMLADTERISVTEYFGGGVHSEIVENGFRARANHSLFGLVDNATEDSERRYERMVEFLQELYAWFPTLDDEDVLQRCKRVLRQEPLLKEQTRSSFVIDVVDKRVEYLVGEGPWQTFRFTHRDSALPASD